MGRNIVPRVDGDSSLGTASKEFSAIYAKELGGTLADIIAPINSPAFSGVPTAPTAGTGTSTTQIATTAFASESVEAHDNNLGAHVKMREKITEEINAAIAKATFDPIGDLSLTYATKTEMQETASTAAADLASVKAELEGKIAEAGTVSDEDLAEHNSDSNAHPDIRQAIADIISQGVGGGTVTKFLASGVYVVPDNVTTLYVSGCGGGGGGSAIYGGGGGASVIRKQITVIPGEEIAVTIGTGGAASNSGLQNFSVPSATSGDGGTTKFGNYVTLPGGKGASYTNSSYNFCTKFPVRGGDGATNGAAVAKAGLSAAETASCWNGGQGGSSLFGTGGTGGIFDAGYVNSGSYSTYMNANDGIGYGAGGGGCGLYNNNNTTLKQTGAGSGSSGIIIVELS